MIRKGNTYILDLAQISKESSGLVGIDALNHSKLKAFYEFIPKTYVLSSLAFDDFLVTNDLINPIFKALEEVRLFDRSSAEIASKKIQSLIDHGVFPKLIQESVSGMFQELQDHYGAKSISIEFSHVLEKRFIPEVDRNYSVVGVRKKEDLFGQIKTFWKRFFSTDAIELRANGYYDGPLTVALLIKKNIRSEISGRAYSIPPITKEEDTLEIHAVYGLVEDAVDYENFSDVYKVDISSLQIKEKHIVPQDYMLVQSGSLTENQLYDTVEISNAWRKRQKLDDSLIKELSEKILELEKKIDKPLILYFSIEAGKIYITDVIIDEKISKGDSDNDEQEFLKKFEVEDKTKKLAQKDKPDLDALEQEINEIISKDDEYLRSNKTTDEVIPLIINPNKARSLLPYPKWTEKYRLITDIYLDISRIHVENLSSIELFNGTYFSGTEFIIDNGKLPEKEYKTKVERLRYVDKLAIEMMSLSKATGVEPIIYSLSNITDYEYKLLGYTDEKNIGDERFIANPDALAFEVLALQKAKNDYTCDNISIAVPNLRNVKNLEDIKSIISNIGLRRSSKMKLYAELSVPSFAYDIGNISKGLIDGVIINYDVLLKLMVYRDDIREVDHDVIINLLSSIIPVIKDKKLEFIFKLGDLSNQLLKNIIKLKPHGIIFTYMPKEEFMKYLQKEEQKIFKNTKNFYTKI